MKLSAVTVVSAVRLGKQPAAEGRPRKLLAKLSSREQAVQVLTSARSLKHLNSERQANGERPDLPGHRALDRPVQELCAIHSGVWVPLGPQDGQPLALGASGGVHLHRVPLTLADNMYGDQRNSLCVCYYLTPLFYFFKENKRVCQWRPPHVS